jgi:hypothetical protein
MRRLVGQESSNGSTDKGLGTTISIMSLSVPSLVRALSKLERLQVQNSASGRDNLK